MMKKRSLTTVGKDGLWPYQGLSPDPMENQRYYALFNFFERVPEKGYRMLKERRESFEWFIPHIEMGGGVWPFFPNQEATKGIREHAKVLYLCPILEQRSFDCCLGVIAHELAHIALDHNIIVGGITYDDQEEEAWELVCEWGFKREVTKVRTVHKWRESWEKTMVKKLSEKEE